MNKFFCGLALIATVQLAQAATFKHTITVPGFETDTPLISQT